MEAREGEQREVVQKWFLKRTPSCARRSMWGVLRWGWPMQERASARWSSVRMKTTLGRAVAFKKTLLNARQQRKERSMVGRIEEGMEEGKRGILRSAYRRWEGI